MLTEIVAGRLSAGASAQNIAVFPLKRCFSQLEECFMRISQRFSFGFLTASLLLAATASAQFKNGAQATELNIPTISQHAVITQRIGLTDVTINYHAPLVGGRKVWGTAAVPYDKVWRSGANQNTTISFSEDVSIEGKPLASGTYGLHMIPTADQWTIIFSKNSTSWGSFSYDEKEDALRVQIKPHEAEFRESLAYTFDDVKPDSALATLRWEKLAVPFRVSTDVKATTFRSIKNQLRSTGGFSWAGYDEAANWCLDNNYELEQALKWEDQSIQGEERFENLETKSRVLKAMNRSDEADKFLAHALDKATAVQLYVYARGLQRQGNAKRAFELYPQVPKKDPKAWIGHLATARVASNSGDFTSATKEMSQAIEGAPANTKGALEPLLKRLQNKDDINK